MKFSKLYQQCICILYVFVIVLSGTCSSISQGNVFFACQNIPKEPQITSLQEIDSVFYGWQTSKENTSSQKFQVTHTSFAKEDCRIEDNSVRTLRKVNSFREEKRESKGRFGFCLYPPQCVSKCLKSIQNQYIDRAKSIETINKLIISYIHQKDGAKGIGLFF